MMDEINYGELFGVELGGNARDVADPAKEAQTDMQGEREPEIAGVSAESPDAGSRGDQSSLENTQALRGGENTGELSGEKVPEVAEPEKKTRQSQEENARFAAARRKAEAERDAAIAEAKAEAKRQMEEFFSLMRMNNPYTGTPITTKEEYDAYKAQYEQEQKNEFLRTSGMSEEEYQQYVETLPEVREAKAAKAEAEQIKRDAEQARAKQMVEAQLKEIGQLDPSVKSLDDLVQMQSYPEFYERVQRGMTMTEAFKLTNYDALTTAAAQASRQAAMNAAAGKQHLKPTQPRGEGAVSVPADVREMYRALNPNATDAEIQVHWRRSQQK